MSTVENSQPPQATPQELTPAQASFRRNLAQIGHGALIDLLLVNPLQSMDELSQQTGYSKSWLSKLINSDNFQAHYAKRRSETVDAVIMTRIDEKLAAVASRSLDIVLDKLDGDVVTPDFALRTAEIALKAAGYGARTVQSGGSTNVNFVVALPQQAKSSAEWSASRTFQSPVVDIAPKG